MEPLPPRYSPDNSPEARAHRMAATSDYPYDHALAWIRFKATQQTVEIVQFEIPGEGLGSPPAPLEALEIPHLRPGE